MMTRGSDLVKLLENLGKGDRVGSLSPRRWSEENGFPGFERITPRLESEAWAEKRSQSGFAWVRCWMEMPSDESWELSK